MTFNEPVVLGRTGLKVGRLGLASGYGAPAEAFEEGFERGCNYWTWGTVVTSHTAILSPISRRFSTIVPTAEYSSDEAKRSCAS